MNLFLELMPMWSVIERASVEEEFAVPEGWEVVEVTEDSFPQYISQVGNSRAGRCMGEDAPLLKCAITKDATHHRRDLRISNMNKN